MNWRILLSCVLFSACSASSLVSERWPASSALSEAEEDFEDSLQTALKENTLTDHLVLKTNQIEHCFYIGAHFTQQFDQLLDEVTRTKGTPRDFRRKLSEKRIYSTLQASQLVGDRLRAQLVYNIKRLRQLRNQEKYRARIDAALAERLEYFRYVPAWNGVALNAFGEDLFTAIPDFTEWKPVFRRLMVGDGARMVEELAKPRTQKYREYLMSKALKSTAFPAWRIEELARTFEKYGQDAEKEEGQGAIVQTKDWPAGQWALTANGGVHQEFSGPTARELKDANIPATFFVNSRVALKYSKVTRRLTENGVKLGNFTVSQPELPRLEKKNLETEILSAQDKMKEFGEISLFRAPYGAGIKDENVKQVLTRAKLQNVYWTVDALNWIDPTPENVKARVQKQMELFGSGIVLFHLGRDEEYSSFQAWVKDLSGTNFRFVSLE